MARVSHICHGILSVLMHVAETTCENGMQDDQLANIGSISIIVHGIPEMNGIHVHNKLVEEIFAMQDVIEITSSQHNPGGIKVRGRNVLLGSPVAGSVCCSLISYPSSSCQKIVGY